MSCHCEKCKDNFYEFYENFFRESDLFHYYELFSDPDLSHQDKKIAWNNAHRIRSEAVNLVAKSLQQGHNLFGLDYLDESYTSEELSDWILSYICQDCWDTQPLPNRTFFYFFSPVASDMFYAIDCNLDFVEKDKEELLSDKINVQLIDAEKSINELENNLSGQIESDLIKVLKTYDDIQTAVVLLKVDMLQALNIAVDYADADGD